jgi:protocatechuate 3,4-dioxygenase, alpha subunit
MPKDATTAGQTPSQTIGPFFAYALAPEPYRYPYPSAVTGRLVQSDTEGERIRIEGRVLDGNGEPIVDALIEIWQANAHGRYHHPADARSDNLLDLDFRGFGRSGTGADPACRFVFDTVKPGPIGARAIGGRQAPHLNLIVLMRGLLSHLYTRIYFSDEALANAADPVLARVPAERRRTLIAERCETPGGVVYRHDIHMQGPDETVFFDV